jgi:nitric oxide reductase activation protein
VHRNEYRPDWCTVHESDPPSGTGSMPTTSTVIAVRRALARLGVGLAPCRRRAQGDDIDLDAAVEARVDRIAGRPHEDDTYIENLRRRRDLAVLILLDVSGSAGEPGTGGTSVHEHQRTTAAALTVALHELGDRIALHAFNSRGRTAVQLWRVKEFDDHLDARVARRLYGLEPAAYTRLGAAIRHGTALLDARGGTPRRLLVVLSDGFAYDHGYEGRRGEADARRALAEARRRGVGCLCLSVGADTDPEALRRVFGPAAHATVPDSELLPRLIGPLFRAALRSAEARRRAFQRTERTRERHEVERRSDGSGATVLRAGR